MSDNWSHEHKYFIFKTFETYELCGGLDAGEGSGLKSETYYVKREYAVLGCNCGSVLKTKVQSDREVEDATA